MSAPPKVSVCIPTYNYAKYLPVAVESVLSQNFTDFEVIVRDDCSTDNTVEVVKKYLSDERVIFGVNERNLGLAGNWNRCLSLAKGKYIKYVFADDLLASRDALGEMASVLDSDPGISLVASSKNIIDEESRVLRVESCFPRGLVAEGGDVIGKCLFEQRNAIGEPTLVMFRREQAARGFSEKYAHLLDMEMWFHLLEQGKFAFLDRPLCSFRVHPAQKTADNVRKRSYLDDHYLLLREYLDRPYIQYGRLMKNYWLLDSLYQFWRLHKKGLVERDEATRRIRNHYPSFFLVYPVFKAIKPIIKIYVSYQKRKLNA
ncbi:MAG: glycosyltransferase [Syntrophobacteraceae bacterium]